MGCLAFSRLLAFSFALVIWIGAPSADAGDLNGALQAASGVVREAYTFLHENPELGKKEFKAHAYIEDKLKALGFTDFIASVEAPTAVIAVLDSGKAEMDARPLEGNKNEPLSHSPRSTIDGLMHNCGHDIHAALLLGAAAVLKQNMDKFAGKVVFLFQPAEETPGGNLFLSVDPIAKSDQSPRFVVLWGP
jgi:amidohydrolase